MISKSTYLLRTVLIAASFACVLTSAVSSQMAPKRTLLVASCAGEDPCGDVTIHSFQFEAGQLVSQGIVHKFPRDQDDFRFRASRTFDNRFVVSHSGVILDLDTKEVFREKLGSFVGLHDGRIVIDQRSFNGIEGITYTFDLASKKYRRYTQPNFYSLWGAKLSPDGKKSVMYQNIASGFFVMTRTGANPSDFSTYRASSQVHKVSCGKKCADPYDIVPFAWIDNDRFLTQRSNGDLVVFDTRSRKWTDLLKIPLPEALERLPTFFQDDADGIYYVADKLYKIDVALKSFSVTDQFDLDNGFSVIGRRGKRTFSFGDQKIASFISGNYLSTDGYLAAEFEEQPSKDAFVEGIRVWGKDVGTWTTIRVKYRPHIMGWLNK